MARSGATGKLFALALAIAAGSAVGDARAQEKNPIIPMLSCPFGCGNTEGYVILGNLLARGGEAISLAPQETPGYMYNIRAMVEERRWKTTVFGTEDIVIQLALQGGKPELKEFLPEPVPIKFKLIGGEAFWAQGKYFVTYDPNLKTPADFKGKRIALGLRTQSDFGFFSRLVLEYGYGITPQNADIRHVNPDTSVQQLIDGNADVAVAAFGTNYNATEWLISGPLRKLEATGRPLHYVGVDQEAIDKVNKRWSTSFLTVNVPAGTLPLQKAPFVSGVNRGYMAVHPSYPDDLAYQLVKAIAKYGPKMTDLHALWKLWSPDSMLHGLTEENVHPGAKRAFVELGWWDRHKNFPPVTYPN